MTYRHIHIEGMGMLGSLLARELHRQEQQFTWNETNEQVSAWRASTGLIYYKDDEPSHNSYWYWRSIMANGWSEYPRNTFLEQSTFWYATKKHPFGLKPPVEPEQYGALRRSPWHNMNLNVQNFVIATRKMFFDCRTVDRPKGARFVIVAHGFDPRKIRKWGWGWSAIVEADFGSIDRFGYRPSLTLPDKSRMRYLYPFPGTPYYYLGTDQHKGGKPKSHLRKGEEKYRAAVDWIQERSGREVSIGDRVDYWRGRDIKEGWRPYGEGTLNGQFVTLEGKELIMEPMGGDGVRLAPEVVMQTLELLKEAKENEYGQNVVHNWPSWSRQKHGSIEGAGGREGQANA